MRRRDEAVSRLRISSQGNPSAVSGLISTAWLTNHISSSLMWRSSSALSWHHEVSRAAGVGGPPRFIYVNDVENSHPGIEQLSELHRFVEKLIIAGRKVCWPKIFSIRSSAATGDVGFSRVVCVLVSGAVHVRFGLRAVACLRMIMPRVVSMTIGWEQHPSGSGPERGLMSGRSLPRHPAYRDQGHRCFGG